ncbi:MAG TPA: metallophosphoesterase family protein [Mycobacteriales bacterium]|nr:metallophosphoesterase family protein [Mycobacteriales bacterium]
MCVPLSRRQLIRYAGLAAATPLVERSWRPVRAFAATSARAVPMHLELVTLTEHTAILTWFTGDPTALDDYGRPAPIPADTTLLLGTAPADLHPVVRRDDETPYHYVELTRLKPNTRYYYRAISNGIDAVPTERAVAPDGALTFVTPQPPPGRALFTMAWLNDLHIGELTSGLALSNGQLPGGGFPPGFPVDPLHPYWKVMTKAAVAEAKARGAELMLVNGDLTTGGSSADMHGAKRWLDGFGPYGASYRVVRGNHDRPVGPDDELRDVFFPHGGPTYFSFDHKGLHIVGLDTVDASGNGAIPARQFDWLEHDLHAHAHRPTFVFGHHPVTAESSVTAVPPVVFTLNPQDATRLQRDVAADTSVVGVYSAHTHRNKRTFSPYAPGVPFVEMGAVKEYPGGYTLVRLFTGGYAVNFYKCRTPAALTWSERSRGEYLNLYPYYTLGSISDRNFVVRADLSDLARPAPA